jgi:hypothetical protein
LVERVVQSTRGGHEIRCPTASQNSKGSDVGRQQSLLKAFAAFHRSSYPAKLKKSELCLRLILEILKVADGWGTPIASVA